MMRKLRWLVPLALLALLLGAGAWLLATEAGLRWAYEQLRTRVPGKLDVEALEGRLAGPLSLRGLRYASDAADATIANARLEWSPSALLLGRLQIDMLALEGARLLLKELDQPPSERPAPSFSFPLNVQIGDLRLKHIQLERPDRAAYTIQSIELVGFVGQEVARIDRLRVDTQNFHATAVGTLGLRGTSEQRMQIDWRLMLLQQRTVAGSGPVTGNLRDLALTQELTEPIAATVRARLREPFGALSWEISTQLPEFEVQRLGISAVAARASASLEASGDRRQFEGRGTVDARAPHFPPLAARFALSGALAGDIVLDQLTVRVPNAEAQLAAQGRWRADEKRWNAEVQWQDLGWPLEANPIVTSPRGALSAAGTLSDYTFRIEAATAGANVPEAQWRARGRADRRRVEAQRIEIDTLGTTLQGAARAAWSPQLEWQARLRGQDINPAVEWPAWPGALALQATASGDRNEMRLTIESLRGLLRGQRFAANALAVRRGAAFPTLALKLQAGNANANLRGSLAEQWNLSWDINAPDLRTVLPQAAGALSGSGRVTGPRTVPRIEARLAGTGLAYKDNRFARANISLALDRSDATPSQLALRATGGSLANRNVEAIAVNANGRFRHHTIALDLRLAGPRFEARAAGGYDDRTWSGVLTQSTLHLDEVAWRLAGTPKLVVAPNRASLEQSCWRADAARLCLQARHDPDAATAFEAAVQSMPLELFRPLLSDAIDVTGTFSGEARAQLRTGRLRRADARFTFSPGDVTVATATKTKFSYESASVELLVDERGLRGDAKLALAQGDGGTLHLQLPQFHTPTDLRHQPVEGRLTFGLRDLTPLDALLLQIDELRGTLHADLTFAGALADPRLRGDVTLTDAAATIPAAGIRVQDVRLTATATGANEFQLGGEARSGGGQLGLSGRVTFPADAAWRAELRIAGAQFLAADLRDAQVYVSPDLHARIAPGQIRVTGDVRIPKAMFGLRTPRPGAVAVSPDVVIVNAPEAPAPEKPWQITAEVRMTLGDAVTFAGFGLSAKISGDVLLIEAPGQATTARGELRVTQGEYEAYGEKLQVERGRLLFVGGPVSNPGIDARAVRRMEQVTVGVEVKGTLRSPQLSLFSDPTMGQADALSYLLFGRPLESASSSEGRSLAAAARALQLVGGERLAQRIGAQFGIEEIEIETGTTTERAALVLGKQLSPRLYINYSIGLFEPENVLRLRYRLSPHWSLEAQSGRSAGGDLFYMIER